MSWEVDWQSIVEAVKNLFHIIIDTISLSF